LGDGQESIKHGGIVAKRRFAKKDRGPTPQELARLWEVAVEGGPDAEEADLLLDAALRSLLDTDRLDRDLLTAILDHLPIDEHHPFLQDCEELAASDHGRFSGASGEDALLQLFLIPVHGEISEVEAAVRDPELLDGIARSLRLTGYAVTESNVLVRPDLFPVQTLALLGPAGIRDLLIDGGSVLARGPGTGVTGRLLGEIRALVGDREGAGPEELLYAVRFLVGVRASVDRGDLADGLMPDPEEPEEAYLDRVERWRDRTEALLERFGAVTIEPPTPWGEARVELLTCALRQLVDLALGAEGYDPARTPYPELRSRIELLPDGLQVELVRDGRVLTGTVMGLELIGPALEGLLDAIAEEYPVLETEIAPARVLVH
jgi:hypothetical protein